MFLVILCYILVWQFCFEGMEEYGSDGLEELILQRKDTFFKVLTAQHTNDVINWSIMADFRTSERYHF